MSQQAEYGRQHSLYFTSPVAFFVPGAEREANRRHYQDTLDIIQKKLKHAEDVKIMQLQIVASMNHNICLTETDALHPVDCARIVDRRCPHSDLSCLDVLWSQLHGNVPLTLLSACSLLIGLDIGSGSLVGHDNGLGRLLGRDNGLGRLLGLDDGVRR